jgi:hypothetical protein
MRRRHAFRFAVGLSLVPLLSAGVAGATSSAIPPGQSVPLNDSPPTISGKAQVGQALNGSPGNWSGPATIYAYQWQRCDSQGANCGGITGAAASTYSPPSADLGSTLRVAVIATNKNGTTYAISDPTAQIQAAVVPATTTPSTTSATTTTPSTSTSATSATTTTPSTSTSTTSATTTTPSTGTSTTTTTASPSSNASCPAPTGAVTYASPGDNLNSKTSGLTAGDTLVLKDGTYYPTGEWLIKGMHGTARAPIIIEAASDGGATIDGSNAGATHLLYVTNSSYLVFCGFNLRNSQRTNLMIAGAGNGTGDVSNITVERVISHNAGSGNQYCFIAQGNTSTADANILFQDDAALGRCRYGFIAYHINGVTFRRDWSSNAYTENFSPAPRSAFGVYAAANVTLENNIGVNEIPATTDNNYYTGVWQTSDDTANWPNNNTVYRGNMFFNGCTGVWLTDTSGTGTVLQDTYIDIPANPVCQANQGSFYRPLGVSWGDPFGGTMTNMAIVNSQTGVSGGTKVITNSVFANNGSALSGSVSGSYNDFYGNGSNGTTLGSTDSTANPNYNTATYGRGAYLMPAPALLGKGSGGADVGAHIIYQYDHGSLTSVPLWPWPMEGRILAATGKSVTYSSAGGIWKTLIGVY